VSQAVGQGLAREDAVAKVTGAARYTGDLQVAGCLHAAIARSEVAHGELLGVDVSRAAAVPGVVATLVGQELAHLDPVFGEWIPDQTPLATDRVRFHGEPLAAVVAETPAIARRAAALVTADVRPLDAYLTPDAARAPGAVPLHDPGDREVNVCHRFDLEFGDVDAALDEAAWVHRATYTFPAAYHYAMEPFSCLADWDGAVLDVWSSTQQPFKVRADLARIYRLDLSQVRMRVPFVGGGYGSKGQAKYEPLTAALAMKVRRPVKLVVDVREAFLTVSRHAARIVVTTGVDAEGTMVARDTVVEYDTGGYADKGPRVAKKGAYRAAGPYRIPNVRATGTSIYTNKPPAGAFRGFSTPQVVWAAESAIDEIADHLGEDPVAYRLRHLKPRGEPFLGADTPLDADLAQGLGLAVKGIGWDAPLGAGRGRGVAVACKDGGGGSARSEAGARLHPDGSIEVQTATIELGQGARTVFRQIAADALGAPVEQVRIADTDTSVVPFDRGTNASRSTMAVGSAVADACGQLRGQLIDMATVDGAVEDLRLDGRDVVVRIAGEESRTPVAELIGRARGLPAAEIGPITAVGAHETPAGAGPLGSSTPFYEVAHGGAEVTVDHETGEVTLERYVSVADVGLAINPVTCVGQDEGAAVMGLGHTLYEELEFDDDGQLLNGALFEYRVPRASDLPTGGLHTVLLENRDGPGPAGAKGAGEGGIIAIAPAVANAVARASGVRLRDLPLTPERVWRALDGGGSTDATPPLDEGT
jgi:CO/xanthine dehydrogenase Mo-binding subunit